MFDLDVSKMIVVGIVALAVIPPKDLPRVMRTAGQVIGKVRRMAAEFQGQFMEAIREAEREADLEGIKREFQAINDQSKIDASFDPVGMIREDMTKAVEAPAEVGKSEIALASPDSAEASLVRSQDAAGSPAPSEAHDDARAVSAETLEREAPAARQSAAE